MEYYDVPSLNTIRQAHRVLGDEGLVKPEQGRGVYVLSLVRDLLADRCSPSSRPPLRHWSGQSAY